MLDDGQGIVGFILTLISLIHGLIACVISFTVVAIIIGYQNHNRLKRGEKITLLLSTNIYSLIFLYIVPLISFNVQTIIGDVYGNNFDSSWCTFRGYDIVAMCCGLYHAFVAQVNIEISLELVKKY